MNISCSKRLDDTVYLLRFAGQANVHKQFPYRNVKWVSDEIEALNIGTKRSGVEGIRTGT